jgi:hypothetical protein
LSCRWEPITSARVDLVKENKSRTGEVEMLRAMILLAVALATASSVWAQTQNSPRRPVPFDRKPVERPVDQGKEQAQAPARPAVKAQPASTGDAKPM